MLIKWQTIGFALLWTISSILVVVSFWSYINLKDQSAQDKLVLERQIEVVKRLNELATLLDIDRRDWIKEMKADNPTFVIPEFRTIPKLKLEPIK